MSGDAAAHPTGLGVAIVTGGGRRIGAAIARRLARDGRSVLIHHRGATEEADALATSIVAAGGTAATVAADLADPGCARIVLDAARRLGHPGLLVNNASLFVSDAVGSIDPGTWDRLFAVNLRAPALLAQAFAAAAQGEDPSIVNIVDQRVWRLTPQHFSYTLTKAALHTATITMAQALAPRIRVNAVGPGPTAPNPTDGEKGLAREAQGTPMGRAVKADEIAEAVAYLAGARAVTGQMIAVDSGQHLGWRTPDIVD
jgi:NAD(P)-dependent dehydrogenase (short-subunit alcohol dehydrogenase family)